MKFASWDLEISRPNLPDNGEIPEGKDIWDFGPFHITVAAVHLSDTNQVLHWYAWDGDTYAPWMDKDTVYTFLMTLADLHQRGYILTTWNGTAFDWRLLAQETGLHRLCVDLALKSFDPMLQFFGLKGFPLSLNAVAKGFGLGEKTQSGSNAPLMWAAGEYQAVLEYVEQDARLLGLAVQAILQQHGIKWASADGGWHFEPWVKLYKANQVRRLPEPDISWMTDPMNRADYYKWMDQNETTVETNCLCEGSGCRFRDDCLRNRDRARRS